MLFLTESRSNVNQFRAGEGPAWPDREYLCPLFRFDDPMQELMEWATPKLATVCALTPEVECGGLHTLLFADDLEAYKIRLRRC
jgi:hypothetical protein